MTQRLNPRRAPLNPARPYRVRHTEWSTYEITVRATNIEQAIDQADVIWHTDGLGAFNEVGGGRDNYDAVPI